MEQLNKLIEISTNILKVYQEMQEIETIFSTDIKSYQDRVEILKMYRELEDRYYQKIFNNSDKTILKWLCQINIDNELEYQIPDTYYVNLPFKIDLFAKRRVANNLSNIYLEKTNLKLESNQKITSSNFDAVTFLKIYYWLHEDFKKEYITLGREYDGYNIICQADNNILLKYLFFVQLNITMAINKKEFINQKYYLIYLNREIERFMLNKNFNINIDFLKTIHLNYENQNNQKFYDDYVQIISHDNYFDISSFDLQIPDNYFKNRYRNYNILTLDADLAFLRANLLNVDDAIIDEQIYEISNLDTQNNTIVRNELIKVLKQTKKDKQFLSQTITSKLR